MRKVIATTFATLFITGIMVVLFSACTLLQGSENGMLSANTPPTATYHGEIHTSPPDAEYYYRNGLALQQRGKHRLALEEFKTAVQCDPVHVEAHNAMGVSADALGYYKGAINAYTAALAIDPNRHYVLNNLGYFYLLQGEFDLAIENFHKALALDSENKRYRNNLGLAYAKRGDDAAAFAVFQTGAEEAEAHLRMARMLYRAGRYQEAADYFAKAAALKPADAQTDKALAAAVSLAGIHAAHPQPPIRDAEPAPVRTDSQPLPGVDHDGFTTIPPGAIETITLVEIEPPALALNDTDPSTQDVPPVHIVSLAGISDPEAELEAAKEIVEEARSKILDEAQAPEWLAREDGHLKNHSTVRVKIEVANGNGVRHMARRVGDYLHGQGFILMYLSNADHFNYVGTHIYYVKGYLADAWRISEALPGLQRLEEVDEVRNGNAEISVLIGRDLTQHLSLFEQG